MRAVDHDELTSVFVIGKQFATHRLEAVTEFLWLKIVEGPPERCPVGDIVWLDIIKRLSERMVPAKTAFEGVERIALELPQHDCSGPFRRDGLNL